MRRAVGFGVTLLVMGAALAVLSLRLADLRVVFLAAGGVYTLLGLLILALRPTRTEGDDVMVGFILFRMPRLALGIAVAEDALLVAFLAALYLGRSDAAWPAFLALSAAALAIAGVGLVALAWSAGRGTAARRRRSAGGLVAAVVLALVPWAIRSVLLA